MLYEDPAIPPLISSTACQRSEREQPICLRKSSKRMRDVGRDTSFQATLGSHSASASFEQLLFPRLTARSFAKDVWGRHYNGSVHKEECSASHQNKNHPPSFCTQYWIDDASCSKHKKHPLLESQVLREQKGKEKLASQKSQYAKYCAAGEQTSRSVRTMPKDVWGSADTTISSNGRRNPAVLLTPQEVSVWSSPGSSLSPDVRRQPHRGITYQPLDLPSASETTGATTARFPWAAEERIAPTPFARAEQRKVANEIRLAAVTSDFEMTLAMACCDSHKIGWRPQF